jgi:hypothetical protein
LTIKKVGGLKTQGGKNEKIFSRDSDDCSNSIGDKSNCFPQQWKTINSVYSSQRGDLFHATHIVRYFVPKKITRIPIPV